jgi:hypothetical protein
MDVVELQALIAYLASRVKIRGKKALQKLVYFCQEAGVPLYATYRLHIYGPYSNEVAEELGEAVAKEILRLDLDGIGFLPGTSCAEYVGQQWEIIAPHRAAIEGVLEKLGGLSPLELELYATVHFVASALGEAYGAADEERVVTEVHRAKGLKFGRSQIRVAYRNLLAWGWLGHIPPAQAEATEGNG